MKRILLSMLLLATFCILAACARKSDIPAGTSVRNVFGGDEQEELSFTLEIKDDTADTIYSAAICWYVDREVIGSRSALDGAGDSLLLPGKAVSCKFLAEDFPDENLSEMKIDVFVKDRAGDVDFVSCGTLVIPGPAYGQVYPVRLVENAASQDKYALVSGEDSLCFVEPKGQAEPLTAGSIDLTGPWHLDETKNALSLLTSTEMMDIFPGFAEWGASMEIRSNGQLSWYIGAVGGSGTYTIEGDILHAELIDAMEQKELSMDFLITGTEELQMTYADIPFIWAYGDREETPAKNQ